MALREWPFSLFLSFDFKLNLLLKRPEGGCEPLKHQASYWGVTGNFECVESSKVLELYHAHAGFPRDNLLLSLLFIFTF